MVLKRLQINMNAPTCFLMVLGILTAVTASDIANCDFYDTVDLTGIQEKNGSYTYKNVEIPSNKIGEYNYTVAPFGDEMLVDKHLRGCLCQVAQCVYFCCEPNKDLPNAYAYFSTNGTDVYMNALEKYVVQAKYRLPCDNFYMKEEGEIFTIQESGPINSYTNNRVYNKEEYCLLPVKINNTYYKLFPTITKADEKTQTIKILKSVSVFCMILTIFVYMYLPKFRTDYNHSCVCYFICLTVSFTLIWIESSYRGQVSMPNEIVCYLIGYSGYYAVMATFLWLLVINYDLWRRFTKLQGRFSGMFRKYNIFVWSVAAMILAITFTIEWLRQGEDKNIDDGLLRPGVGIYYCWINTLTWAAMVFLYGPILVMLIIIMVLSFLTAKRIYVDTKVNRSIWNTSESQTNVTNQANFAMFFRMFAISGVVWITEIISYLFSLDTNGKESFIDWIPCSQGILLFIVTIWKMEVFKALYKKMEKKERTRVTSSTFEKEVQLCSRSTKS